MKNKQKNQKELFSFGAILVAVGVVFLISANTAIGAAIIALGGIFMLTSAKQKNKK